MLRSLSDIMKTKRLLGRRGFALVFIESVIVYCRYTIKKTFVKVVRGSAISSVWLDGVGMKKSYVRRCHCEIARCA